MADEIRFWRVMSEDKLTEINHAQLDLEQRLQEWLAKDISILAPGLLVIGREVKTDFGGYIDILCVDEVGDLTIVELKRNKTPREVTAQVLDYASWVADISKS
jgi:RecB family endonuclease NucS